MADYDVTQFARDIDELPGPVLAFCRTGNRSVTLWSMVQARRGVAVDEVIQRVKAIGFDMTAIARKLAGEQLTGGNGAKTWDVLIVGGGAGGAAASSLLARDRALDIAIVDPAEVHYYQPGWTLVGAGVFDKGHTVKTMASLMPEGVEWIKAAVMAFEPEQDRVVLENCRRLSYRRLIVAPGIKLDWHGVEGLRRPSATTASPPTTASTWRPTPGNWCRTCAAPGPCLPSRPCPSSVPAPRRRPCTCPAITGCARAASNIEVEFHNAGGVLFGVKDYVPALMEYVERYQAPTVFQSPPDPDRRARAYRLV